MLHTTLWNRNRDLADACLQHPFVQKLGDDTLDPEYFKRYIAQDAFFLQAYIRAYALSAAKCENVELIRTFHILMGGTLDELRMHRDFSRELGIDLKDVQPL